MPCRDWQDEPPATNGELMQRYDKLARIACKALQHIEDTENGLEILILKDPEVAEWWREHKEADRKRLEKEAEEARKAALRKSALKKLTKEEKDILGIK